jgi:hypothetical protein
MGGVLAAVGLAEAGAKKRKRRGKHKQPQGRCSSCGDGCPGAPENNPTKSVTFTSAGGGYCAVNVNLTGFAGCTEYTAEYWSAATTSGNKPKYYGNVTLGPTDLSGSSQTNLGTFFEGGAVDIRFVGAAANFQWVDC